MKIFNNQLKNVRIASPCSANWDEMIGDEQKRFCSKCNLNVYNLSGMSQLAAEKLLLESEGRLCVRFYRRTDGSVLMQDCPVGWQAVKRRVSRLATAAFSLLAGLFGGLGIQATFESNKSLAMNDETPIYKTNEEPTMGAVAVSPASQNSQIIMGDVAGIATPPTQKNIR